MDVEPSKLGMKSYWDAFYQREIENFEENPSDTGECWFDDTGAEDRMIEFLTEDPLIELREDCKVLDLGTGNGHLLFALREAGVGGVFLGLDYSRTSVDFASRVAASNNVEDVIFRQHDIISTPVGSQFDLVLDKGTLDAIALSDDRDAKFKYAEQIRPLVKKGGHFMITSCNFTKEELVSLINLPHVEEIEYPRFEFGGQSGSSVVTLVFGSAETG